MTLATSTIALTDGLEALIKKVPLLKRVAHELSMMMSIALRFIPTLTEETERIMKAQKSRGADFESGNIVARAKSLIPILVPLFVCAFQRANELAMAMESRCYTAEKTARGSKSCLCQKGRLGVRGRIDYDGRLFATRYLPPVTLL
jgi:energy-coupling factor transport system permease protein